MKWKLVSYVVLLVCVTLQAVPVLAANSTTTITGTVPLVTYEVSVSNISYHSATISWKTNGNATSQVFYDTIWHDNITGYADNVSDDSLVSEHSLNLTGLSSANTYHYRVKSVATVDGVEFIATSEDYTFTTLTPRRIVESGGPSPPPPPPAPPPGTTDVSDIVTTDGVFTEEVVAESFDNLCHLVIDKDTKGLTKDKEPLSQITMVEMEEPPPPPEDVYTIGLIYDFGPDGATFDPPIALTISYDPSLITEGVLEEDLVIAYYDEDAEKWVELDSVVDTEANTISAKVSHFTAFAVLGYEVVVPPVIPATFTVSDLTISPTQVNIGERVSISVIVANTGGESGSCKVTLKINGVIEATTDVTVRAGASKEITFTTTKDIAGTYLVDVDRLTGSFTVKEKAVPPVVPVVPPVIPKAINWPLIGGIIGVIAVGLLVYFLVIRRRRAQGK